MSSCLPLYDFLFHQLFKITELLERLKVALKKIMLMLKIVVKETEIRKGSKKYSERSTKGEARVHHYVLSTQLGT